MKTFLILYEQKEGSGCDYTIGCGINYEIIHAKSIEDAKCRALGFSEEWKNKCKTPEKCNKLLNDGILYNLINYERRCENITLYEVTKLFNLMELAKEKLIEIETYKKELEIKKQEEHERKQYKILKKKFES